jgi:hypothetical protein
MERFGKRPSAPVEARSRYASRNSSKIYHTTTESEWESLSRAGQGHCLFQLVKGFGWPGLEPLWAKPRKSVCGRRTGASLRSSPGHPSFNKAKALRAGQGGGRGTRWLEGGGSGMVTVRGERNRRDTWGRDTRGAGGRRYGTARHQDGAIGTKSSKSGSLQLVERPVCRERFGPTDLGSAALAISIMRPFSST